MANKKVLFVDEKFYRFSHYYEDRKWWIKNGIYPIFKSYDNKNSKYQIYMSLLRNRPDYIVMVQLSTKNIILIILANLLGIKTIFWQHGFFYYPVEIKSVLKKFPLKLNYLLALSKYDIENISNIFSKVNHKLVIEHYDLAKINFKKTIPKDEFINIAYIGQIISKEQVYGSNAKLMEKLLGEKDYFIEILDEILNKNLSIRILAKKHPGDKSNYLEQLSNKYEFMQVCSSDKIFQCDIAISHYSTLMLAFLQLNKPVMVLPLTNGSIHMDLSMYDNNKKLIIIKSVEDFIDYIDKYDNTHRLKKTKFQSISNTLLKIINEK